MVRISECRAAMPCSSHRMRLIFYQRALLITKTNNALPLLDRHGQMQLWMLEIGLCHQQFQIFFFLLEELETGLNICVLYCHFRPSAQFISWRTGGCCQHPSTYLCPEGLLAGTLWPCAWALYLAVSAPGLGGWGQGREVSWKFWELISQKHLPPMKAGGEVDESHSFLPVSPPPPPPPRRWRDPAPGATGLTNTPPWPGSQLLPGVSRAHHPTEYQNLLPKNPQILRNIFWTTVGIQAECIWVLLNQPQLITKNRFASLPFFSFY